MSTVTVEKPEVEHRDTQADQAVTDIAIVGMAARFPGAATLAEFWDNLCAGRHAITFFTEEELRAAGVGEDVLSMPNYVRAGGVLPDVDLFDASFFGMSPSEAEVLDPQHRLFLEMAWEVLENAGYDPFRFPGSVGLFAGSGAATYLMYNIAPNIHNLIKRLDAQQILNGNDKDFLPLRVAYKLDLRGPTVNVQSACSTSLVAVHFACQSLLNGECDMALAGGIRISVPVKSGYFYREGQISSPDGFCRAFDANAAGTVGGHGGGLVALKMLDQAKADGDRILAVIKGSAVNNDGKDKISFTAPSIEGQSAAIREAMAVGGVDPRTVTFIETHGTGTALGDPIEIAALSQAFGEDYQPGSCALTATKANIGHLDAGAGIAGLIKAVLVLQNKQIPPSANFDRPNAKIDFKHSPFYVNKDLREWQRSHPDQPLRAGVSSFGMGGTNAHVVLQESPEPQSRVPGRAWQFFPLSAKNEAALDRRFADLAAWLQSHEPDLADLAFTLQSGRADFSCRAGLVASDTDTLREALQNPSRLKKAYAPSAGKPVAFVFAGQGSQKVGMGADLYRHEPVFRDTIDSCADLLFDLGFGEGLVLVDEDGTVSGRQDVPLDLRRVLYPPEKDNQRAENLMRQTAVAQVALFAFEYALAKVWTAWGVRPEALIGHSLGEVVAACLAGVFSLEDALYLVSRRGSLMQAQPPGAMLAVSLEEGDVAGLLDESLALAAVNGQGQCVVSGPIERIRALADELAERKVTCRRLVTSHAFHSAMMTPILQEFRALIAGMELGEPSIAMVSNLTGDWITAEQATSPDYWCDHLRNTVRFHDGLTTLFNESAYVFLEVGPGKTLTNLILRHQEREEAHSAFASFAKGQRDLVESVAITHTVAALWLDGTALDWRAYHGGARQRLALPTYPFQRRRYWIASPLEMGQIPALPHGDEGLLETPLAEPEYERPELQTVFATPEGDDEKTVAAIWGELLGIKRIGRDDDFLELGGDSLVTTQIHVRLREAFGLELPLQPLFELTTIAAQAEWVAQTRMTSEEGADGGTPAMAPLVAKAREGEIPLSFAQQRLWVLDRIEGSNPAYHMPAVLVLNGVLNLEALEASFSEIVRRHEIMRTGFPERNGKPYQHIEPAYPVTVPIHDLTEMPGQEGEAHLGRLLNEWIARPFDLAKAPCFRLALFRLETHKHVLAMVQHHIISDGWSTGVLVQEFGALYQAAVVGEPLEWALPPLEVQYADFAMWQRKRLDGEAMAGQLEFWRQRHEGLPPHIDLPTDRPHPPLQTFNGATEGIGFDETMTARLRAFAKRHDATLFMVLEAAFATLMFRYSHQSDIAVGTPIANRTHRALEAMVGCFINTLVLRTSFDNDPNFIDLIAQTRRTALDAYAHQDVPFEEVVEAVQPRRDMSRNPLFQVMFILQNTPRASLSLPELELSPFPGRNHFAKFELQFDMRDLGERLFCQIEYNTDLFDGESVRRLAAHFHTLTAGLIESPERPVRAVAMLDRAERDRIALAWNRTDSDFKGPRHLLAPFERWARLSPERPAVRLADGAGELSYAELRNRAESLAVHLARLGVGPETLVGVALQRSLEMVVAQYAVVKAGGAYVPIDPEYPAERVAFMLEDCAAPVLLTTRTVLAGLPEHQAKAVCLDEFTWNEIDDDGRALLEEVADGFSPSRAAYMIYTSGSTGRPKGAVNTHEAIANRLDWMQTAYPLDDSDRVLQKTPFSFDVSVWEFFWPLRSGATLVMAEPERHGDPSYLADVIQRHTITTMHFVPSMLDAFLSAADLSKCGSLRRVFASGEALSVDLATRFTDQLSAVTLHNLYGPTEAAIDVTYHRVRPDEHGRGVPIGKAIANTRVYLTDRYGELVAQGVSGELLLGGLNLARGYHHRPGLTASRFIPNPFGRGERLYRTGDLARFRNDGELEFLGRIDHQVKLHGFRIELGDIETALLTWPDFKQAVALVRSEGSDQRLVAFVVAEKGQPGFDRVQAMADTAALRAHLAERLPRHMIPNIFVALEALPVTANGKLDRRELNLVPIAVGTRGKETVTPRSANERILVDIWKSHLPVTEVGVHDNYFELGGDSILAIQIVSKARAAGLALTPKQMFEWPTIAQLASHAGQTAVEVLAPQGEVTGDLPLVPIQRWFFEQHRPHPHHFNQAMLFDLGEEGDPRRLERAVSALVAHHDALRTRFEFKEGRWHQTVTSADLETPFEVHDLRNLADRARTTAIEARCAELQAGHRLESGCLIKVALFRCGAAGDRLFLTIHHLVVDGMSWRVLLEDLMAAYQKPESAAIQLPPKTSAMRDWARALEDYAQSDRLLEELPYWQETLRLAAQTQPLPLDMPAIEDEPGSANPGRNRSSVVASLDGDLTRCLLTQVPAVYNTRINDLLLTALLLAYHRWTGSSSLVLDLEGHGREHLFPELDVSRTVGWFTSLFPVRLELQNQGEPGATLMWVKETLREVPHHGIGFGLLRYLCKREEADCLKQDSGSDLLFNYLGHLDAAMDADAALVQAAENKGPDSHPENGCSHTLEVNALIAGGRFQVNLDYASELHREATVQAFADGFVTALTELAAHCRQPEAGAKTPSDFPLVTLSQKSLTELVGRGKSVADLLPLTPMQSGMLFHAMFERTAAYHQQFVAVLAGKLDTDAFLEAWRRTIRRHASLRARFFPDAPDHAYQAIMADVELDYVIGDWSGLDNAKQQAALEAFLAQDRERGFELDVAPLIRFALFRLSETRYQFILSNHHLNMDGWSTPIVLIDLFKFYEETASGTPLDWPAPGEFRDYIAWLNHQDLVGAEAFWRANLDGFRAPTPLAMQTRPAASSPAEIHRAGDLYRTVRVKLEKAAFERLNQFVHSHHFTLNTLAQAAWAYLLALYSGGDDVVFGETVSGRPAQVPDVETMVGMFINTLPVRIRLDREMPLERWLHEIQDDHLARDPYAFSPLVDIHRWSEIDRTQPLFESLLIFENYPLAPKSDAEELDADKHSLWVEDFTYFERTNYPLVIKIAAWENMTLAITYNADRFDAEAMETLLVRFTGILDAMVDHGNRPLGELAILEEAERRKLLCDWNRTAMALDRDLGIHQLFERQALKSPDAIALRGETEKGFADLTYDELNRRAERLAGHLLALGVTCDMPVGMACDRSPAMLVALLGILKAGAAYVPMDPAFPAERLAWMAQDSGLAWIVIGEQVTPAIEALGRRLIRLDPSGWLPEAREPDSVRPRTSFQANALAYVIYTSGSTGKPKGVQLSHRSVVNFLTTMADTPGISASDILLAVTTISFDIAGLELYLPLSVGAQVVLASSATAGDGARLAALTAHAGATAMQATPATWQMLLASGWEGDPHLKILCGGEALPGALARELMTRGQSLWNLYGPTETTIWSTCEAIDAAVLDRANLPIGRPIGNTTAYVLDRTGKPVPVGIPGHLHQGGEGLARGYRNRPGLTAQRFVPDAFGVVPGARLYATGDLVKYLADGRLVYLGRLDHQIKLRGFRIELGEIESALAESPGIREAVALVREDRPGDRRLVAYYVPGHGEPVPSTQALRDRLAAQLPAYMLPAALVAMDAFPMTPNRKVDRRALPIPELPEIEAHRPLRTPVEELVAGIWADVLHLETIGGDAHFFMLGGHSLLAAQVVSRVRRRLEVAIPMSELFEAPTVTAFAKRVEAARASGNTPKPAIAAQPRQSEGPWQFPLSSAQQQLWLFQQITGDSTPYHMPLTLQIDGPLVPDALEMAFRELIHRHESLRTTFEMVEEHGVQIVHPVGEWSLPLEDLSELPESTRQTRLTELIHQHGREPFLLQTGPLFRVLLVKLEDTRHAILINQHHIISDAWSLGNLALELTTLYGSFAEGEPSPLPELPLQYADFAVWERTWFQDGGSEELVEYWRGQLKGLADLQPLPLAKPRPDRLTSAPGVAVFTLPDALVADLRALGHEEGATLFMVLLAALNALTAHHTASDDIAIGTDVANRDLEEMEPMIGFFVNQVVLRTGLREATTFRDVLKRTRETVLAGYAHQQLPFDQVVAIVNPDRRAQINPLFQMKLVLQNVPVKARTVHDLTFTALPRQQGLAKFDLLWNMQEFEQGLVCDMQFNRDLYSEKICSRLAGHLRALLEQVVSQADLPLDTLGVLLEKFDKAQREKSGEAVQSARRKLLQKAKRKAR